jgi:hypothetical protein
MTNALNKNFISMGEYRFDPVTNVVTPWNESYVFIINRDSRATTAPVIGRIAADSVVVTYVGPPK